MSDLSDNITMRFCFNKSETETPNITDIYDHELDNIKKCFKLNIEFSPDDEELEITQIKFLYDGITDAEDEQVGCYFDEHELVGYPTPIIAFKLNKKVELNAFKQSIFFSSVSFTSQKMAENDCVHIMEDYNGYSNPLTDEEVEDVIEYLTEYDVFHGKVIDFPDGMPKFGYILSGEEFIKN